MKKSRIDILVSVFALLAVLAMIGASGLALARANLGTHRTQRAHNGATATPQNSLYPGGLTATPTDNNYPLFPTATSTYPTPVPTSTTNPYPTPTDNYPTPTSNYPPYPTPTDNYPTPTDNYPTPTDNYPTPPVYNPTPTPIVIPTPTPTPTPTPGSTATATPSPTSTATATPTPSPTGTATATPTPSPTATATSTPSPTATVTPTPTPTITPTPPGKPTLDKLAQVTAQAFTSDTGIADSWGAQKGRFIRTSTGDLFVVYISEGIDEENREWHLLHQAPNGTSWDDVQHGNAGSEPVSIVRGPHDEIHVFAWSSTLGTIEQLKSTDLGKTFKSDVVTGKWLSDVGYSGSSIDDKGDIVFYQSDSKDVPGHLLWSYYSVSTNTWQFHDSQIDYRYISAYFFVGAHNDLTIVGVRNVLRSELKYPSPNGPSFISNAIAYFYIPDVNNPQVTEKTVAEIQPQNDTDSQITTLADSYVDTQGRTHILYTNLYDGADILHHAIVEDGKVTSDVKQNVSFAGMTRIVQDTQKHFYLVSMDTSGKTLNIYPGSAKDTDGTQLDPVVKLDISQYPGCTDSSKCLEPTLNTIRSGNGLADEVEGVYENGGKVMYFRVKLR